MKTWVIRLLLLLVLGTTLVAWAMRPDAPRAALVTTPAQTETSPPREATATNTVLPPGTATPAARSTVASTPISTATQTPVRAASRAQGAAKQNPTPTPKAVPVRKAKPKPDRAPTPVRRITLYVRGKDYSGANLRAKPSVRSSALSTLPYAARVEAESRPRKAADGRAWYKVTYRARTGYVAGSLLAHSKPAPRPEPPIIMYVASEGYEGVNLRARASTESPIVATIPYAARVQAARKPVRGADGAQWYEVTYRAHRGYVLGRLLTDRTPPDEPTPDEPTPDETQQDSVPAPEQEPSAPIASVGLPVRLSIDTAGVRVDAPVEYVGLTAERAMDTPDGWWNVGWYRLGPRPGQEGNAVLAGHLDSTSGPAVFWDLAKLRIGDGISVTDEYGNTIRFVVRRMVVYDATDAPMDLIFGPTQGAHLNLITCQGTFSGSAGYDSRLVVFTDLVE